MNWFDDANTWITNDGFLIAHPRVARAGIELHEPEGFRARNYAFDRPVRVYRPEDELFRPNTLRSLANKPITLDHPDWDDCPVNAKNWKRFAVGTTGDYKDVLKDGGSARISILVMDQAAIKAVQSGTRQLSFAYRAQFDVGDGVTPEGEPYDAIERDIVFSDHLAIVPEGRGGPTLAIGDQAMINNVERPRGFVRGFAFADQTVARAESDAARVVADASARAYLERSKRMASAWRLKDQQDAADPASVRTPIRTPV